MAEKPIALPPLWTASMPIYQFVARLVQSQASPPAIAATAVWGQQADIQGTVKAFKMTPVGDLEGMILTDGTEVHVSAQLAAAVRPGEAVRVLGWRTSVPNFVVATSLTGQHGQSVVDQGPLGRRQGP